MNADMYLVTPLLEFIVHSQEGRKVHGRFREPRKVTSDSPIQNFWSVVEQGHSDTQQTMAGHTPLFLSLRMTLGFPCQMVTLA